MAIDRNDVTGLVLAGGAGRRMGGADKGLQPLDGTPLAVHALRRLAPQVGPLMISANRNLDTYRRFGVPVCADAGPGYLGPLAGWLAGLSRCRTRWLATVPCDTPHFPQDLVARLAAALVAGDAEVAIAETCEPGGLHPHASAAGPRPQPAFALLDARLHDALAADLAAGARALYRWTGQRRCVRVTFPDAADFRNLNTTEALSALGTGADAAKHQGADRE